MDAGTRALPDGHGRGIPVRHHRSIARDIVRSLAVRTEESAFLSVRRGDETVCLLREEGSFPIRSFVLVRRGALSARRGVGGARDPRVPARPTMWTRISSGIAELPERLGRRHGEPARCARASQRREARGYAVNPGLIVEGS